MGDANKNKRDSFHFFLIKSTQDIKIDAKVYITMFNKKSVTKNSGLLAIKLRYFCSKIKKNKLRIRGKIS
jgi:hypothetical protein